jgi:hypothetical protein
LKTKTFILEKFLDTAFRGNIRFLPESSDWVLNEPPLELFSLEREAAVARRPLDFLRASTTMDERE